MNDYMAAALKEYDGISVGDPVLVWDWKTMRYRIMLPVTKRQQKPPDPDFFTRSVKQVFDGGRGQGKKTKERIVLIAAVLAEAGRPMSKRELAATTGISVSILSDMVKRHFLVAAYYKSGNARRGAAGTYGYYVLAEDE